MKRSEIAWVWRLGRDLKAVYSFQNRLNGAMSQVFGWGCVSPKHSAQSYTTWRTFIVCCFSKRKRNVTLRVLCHHWNYTFRRDEMMAQNRTL